MSLDGPHKTIHPAAREGDIHADSRRLEGVARQLVNIRVGNMELEGVPHQMVQLAVMEHNIHNDSMGLVAEAHQTV